MSIPKATLAATLVLATTLAGAWAADLKLEGIQCVIAPRPVDATKSADYKDGKVFFCCNGCSGKFAQDQKKFATAANQQLVATKQYQQHKCPISGGKLTDGTELKIGQNEVKFCCNNCKGKVAGVEEKEQAELVFGEKAFEKAGFAKVKAEKE